MRRIEPRQQRLDTRAGDNLWPDSRAGADRLRGNDREQCRRPFDVSGYGYVLSRHNDNVGVEPDYLDS